VEVEVEVEEGRERERERRREREREDEAYRRAKPILAAAVRADVRVQTVAGRALMPGLRGAVEASYAVFTVLHCGPQTSQVDSAVHSLVGVLGRAGQRLQGRQRAHHHRSQTHHRSQNQQHWIFHHFHWFFLLLILQVQSVV
jgi:hypothetical protein